MYFKLVYAVMYSTSAAKGTGQQRTFWM